MQKTGNVAFLWLKMESSGEEPFPPNSNETLHTAREAIDKHTIHTNTIIMCRRRREE